MSEGNFISRWFGGSTTTDTPAADASTTGREPAPASTQFISVLSEANTGLAVDAPLVPKGQQMAQLVDPGRPATDSFQLAQAPSATESRRKKIAVDPTRKAFLLPADTSLDDPLIEGSDIVLRQPDGTLIVLEGAITKEGDTYTAMPIMVGTIMVPAATLAAALGVSQVQIAAGPGGEAPNGSGGNLAAEEGGIGDPYAYSPLLLPTEFGFPPRQQEEILPPAARLNNGVTLSIPAIGQLGTRADERGLDGIGEQEEFGNRNEGSGEAAHPDPNTDNSERTTGTITFSALDGLRTVTINGVAVTGPGQIIKGQNFENGRIGEITIVSFDPAGTITYIYTLVDNANHSGGPVTDAFNIVVTDTDGESATGTLQVEIVDDVPQALDEAPQSVTEGVVVFGLLDFVQGADGAIVTAIGGVNVVIGEGGWSQVFSGAHGSLQVRADGNYRYTAQPDDAVLSGGPDSFTYTVTDGDGDTDSAQIAYVDGRSGRDDGDAGRRDGERRHGYGDADGERKQSGDGFTARFDVVERCDGDDPCGRQQRDVDALRSAGRRRVPGR